MITTDYISFVTSLLSSMLGLGIVFLSLICLAIFVMIVSKVILVLEKNAPTKPQAAAAAVSAPVSAKPAAGAEAIKVAVIAAAISEERREPLNAFVITNIKKL